MWNRALAAARLRVVRGCVRRWKCGVGAGRRKVDDGGVHGTFGPCGEDRREVERWRSGLVWGLTG